NRRLARGSGWLRPCLSTGVLLRMYLLAVPSLMLILVLWSLEKERKRAVVVGMYTSQLQWCFPVSWCCLWLQCAAWHDVNGRERSPCCDLYLEMSKKER